jgi:hypothetical protein
LDHATEKIWSQPAETVMSPTVEVAVIVCLRQPPAG